MRSVRVNGSHCQLPRYLQYMHQALTCNHPLRLPLLRILSRLLPVVFMLPDAHSWCGLLPSLICLPCTDAVDAFKRAALCAGHCVLSAIIAANEHAASVRKSRLRCFRRLLCYLPAAAALTRTSRSSILDPQPQLARAIAGRSCFAVRFFVMCEEKRALLHRQ